MEMDKKFLEEINDVDYLKVLPKDYAGKLKKVYLKDKSLWYSVITPAIKADELFEKTKGDYSLIWEEHCACCFKSIDKNTTENVYVSNDKFIWLCEGCYNLLIVAKH